MTESESAALPFGYGPMTDNRNYYTRFREKCKHFLHFFRAGVNITGLVDDRRVYEVLSVIRVHVAAGDEDLLPGMRAVLRCRQP